MVNYDRVLAQLDAIEGEMKRIGYWSTDPPAMPSDLQHYLEAPSFEPWLQCVFLPRARAAASGHNLPQESQVGLMALRQYDYHSHAPEAQPLLQLLCAFDALVEAS